MGDVESDLIDLARDSCQRSLLLAPDRRSDGRLLRRHESVGGNRSVFMWGLASMNNVVLIRHVETDLRGTFCGQSDPDLNAAGENRLRSLLEEVVPLAIENIYSSDLRRASRTAIAIGERIGAPVELRPGLREIHFGLWEGLRWDEIQLKYPREARLWVSEFPNRCAPGGEPYRDFTARIEAEFRLVIARPNGASSAVVTHRGVIEYALTRLFGFCEEDARKRTENYGTIVVATPSRLAETHYTGVTG